MEGTHQQVPKGAGEEEEEYPTSNASKELKVNLLSHSHTNIAESAQKIKSVE